MSLKHSDSNDTSKKTMPVVEPINEDIAVGQVLTQPASLADKSHDIELRDAYDNYVPGTDVEKKLVRKIDLYLLPMLWVMCILAYIDRNNIGNAQAAGMGADLKLSDNNYAMLVSIFFIAYCSWEVPSNVILSRVRPSIYVPALMLVWGCIVCGMSQVDNYSHILVARFFLGIIEAGFFPGVLFIFTCWYKKSEIGKRWCFFYTALCVSGAASGLISGAVISGLEGVRGMRGWRWLFLIEGVITIGVAIIAHFVLLDYPQNAGRRFTEEERRIAVVRLMREREESINRTRKLTPLQSVKAAFCDVRVYFYIVLFQLANASTTMSYFIPTVLGSMGYSGTEKQWMTVPVWATGIVILCIFPYLSDRTGNRQYFILGGLATGLISSIVCVSQQHNIVRYVFLCFFIAGVYMTLPLILNWASELMGQPTEKRAVIIAMINCMGSISSIYGSYLWPSKDAPKYTKGFATVSVFLGFDVILVLAMPFIFRVLPKTPTKAERELEMED